MPPLPKAINNEFLPYESDSKTPLLLCRHCHSTVVRNSNKRKEHHLLKCQPYLRHRESLGLSTTDLSDALDATATVISHAHVQAHTVDGSGSPPAAATAIEAPAMLLPAHPAPPAGVSASTASATNARMRVRKSASVASVAAADKQRREQLLATALFASGMPVDTFDPAKNPDLANFLRSFEAFSTPPLPAVADDAGDVRAELVHVKAGLTALTRRVAELESARDEARKEVAALLVRTEEKDAQIQQMMAYYPVMR